MDITYLVYDKQVDIFLVNIQLYLNALHHMKKIFIF